MNIQEYISSGILELYVLGELPSDEQKQVEQMAKEHPEINKEIGIIQETINTMATKTAITPNPKVKEMLFSRPELKEGTSPLPGSKLKSMPPEHSEKQSNIYKYLLAASVALLLISSIAAVSYWSKWKKTATELSETETELQDLIAQNQSIAQDFNNVKNRLQKMQTDFEVASSGNFQHVRLQGLEKSPASLAFIYWNDNTKEVYLDIEKLPETSEDKQYQLWAIVDGKPVDAGVFDITTDTKGLLKMKDIPEASAFAVTLEPKGGSEKPTMEEMYVHGEVGKS